MRLSKLLQCTCLTRWHTVEMSRPQNLAEHQWSVAMIVAEFMEQIEAPQSRITKAVALALIHDADEVDAGDIPAYAKGKPVPKEDFTERAVQVADKMEANWFAEHHAIGIRAAYVREDTAKRLNGLIQTLEKEEMVAWAYVMEGMKNERNDIT